MKRIIDIVSKQPVFITVVVFFIFYFMPFKPKPFGDGEYHIGTIQLIDYILNGFQGTVRVDKGLFTLFYYLIPYSLAYVFHNDFIYYFFGIVFNAFVICYSIKFLFKSFDLLNMSTISKFWVIVILNLFPIHVYYGMGILAESAAFFAVSLFVYSLVKIVLGFNEYKYYILLSFSLIILIGTRPNLLPFVIIFSIYFLLTKNDWKMKLVYIGSILISTFLLTSLESKLTHDNQDFKSTVFRNQILWSRFELRDEPFNWLPQHGHDGFESKDYLNNLKKRRELDSICEVNHYDKTKYFINWVKNDIINNPFLTLRQYSLKFFQSQSFIISPLMKSNKNNFVKFGIHIYINLINYILVIVGLFSMFKLFRNKNYKLFIPFLLFWGWSLLYVFMFHSEQRYMFPARPILLFLFAFFVSSFGVKNSNNEK